VAWSLAFAVAVAGCGGGGGTLTGAAGSRGGTSGGGGRGGAGGTGTGGASDPATDGSNDADADVVRLFMRDANNYTAAVSLTIPVVQTAAGIDLRVCWNGLAKDLQCHDIAPGNGIDNVAFLQIPNMTRAQVAAALAVGQLDASRISKYFDYHTAQTPSTPCADLSQLRLGATSLVPATDYIEASTTTYLLLFGTGTAPGVGSRSMLFLQPTSASTVNMVQAVDACAANAFQLAATLGEPLSIARTDSSRWLLDWGQVTRDSFGNAVSFAKLDALQIGFYQNLTAADLQARFVDIDLIATSTYEIQIPVDARSVDLAGARLRGTGAVFPGFTRTDGVWSVAVRCSRCQTSQPDVFSVLQPE